VKLIAFLFQTNGRGILVVTLAGILSGAASSLFVAMVNASLHRPDHVLLAIGFGVVVAVRISANIFSQWFLVRFAQTSILELCDTMCRRVLDTPFRTLERVGPSRIMTTLTDDVGTLTGALQAIPSVITNAAILLGCTVYLAWLSWKAALVLAGFALIGAVGYRILTRRAARPIAEARAERETLFRTFRTLTEGIKELKMNRTRRQAFLDTDLTGTTHRLRRINLSATRHYLFADAWAQIMFFGIMGVMLFALPSLEQIPLESLTGYVFVALYAMTPLWGFMGALPIFHRGDAALTRINDLGLSLMQRPAHEGIATEPATVPGASIEMRDVTFTYNSMASGTEGFSLGPVSMAVHSGELVFVIGGNGSGKSTFVKLLTGLYAPDSGEITINGRPVGMESRDGYREHFSAVFSDFFLFENLAGASREDLDLHAQSYLRLLGLDHVVHVQDGVLSTTALSQGQRRRLALLNAYLEDRPVYVFDEWAADQDPAYRQIFYSKFLPELKARGKTVVVITHDDRYFYLGDRIIKLEYGKIVDAPVPEYPHAGLATSGVALNAR
jgi:putative ATP-binding cassette transporter